MAAVTAVKSPDTGPAVKEKRFYLDVKWVVILAIVAFLLIPVLECFRKPKEEKK